MPDLLHAAAPREGCPEFSRPGAAWGRGLALEMLTRAGFGRVTVERLPHDIQNFYYVCARS